MRSFARVHAGKADHPHPHVRGAIHQTPTAAIGGCDYQTPPTISHRQPDRVTMPCCVQWLRRVIGRVIVACHHPIGATTCQCFHRHPQVTLINSAAQ